MTRPGRIVVVGSLHHDIMVEADRQPQRGETLPGHVWYPKFGGKGGNQAVAAARMGAAVTMVGAVGDDDFGRHLRGVLAAEGIDHRHVATLPGGSGMSVAIVDAGGDYAAVVVTGANAGIDPGPLARPGFWDGAAALVLQNEVPPAVNAAASSAARAAGVPVIWNAAPWRAAATDAVLHAEVLVVNAVEAAQATGTPVDGAQSARVAATALTDRAGAVVVTLGAGGLVLAERGKGPIALPARPVETPRAHGAGDVFTGALAAAVSAGLTLRAAAGIAIEAAWRHVSGRDIAGAAPWTAPLSDPQDPTEGPRHDL